MAFYNDYPCDECGDTPTHGTSEDGERLCDKHAIERGDIEEDFEWDDDAPQSLQREFRIPETFECVCGASFSERWERESHWSNEPGVHGIPVIANAKGGLNGHEVLPVPDNPVPAGVHSGPATLH